METGSVFAHVSLLLHAHPENVATEALRYILNKDAGAWRSLRSLLGMECSDLPEQLRFESQVSGPDNAIPDLLGHDANGVHRVILEAKFWAGLTDKQPVDYLRMLPDGATSSLVVIAPAARIETLWPKLLARVRGAGLPLQLTPTQHAESKAATVGPQKHLLILSWRSVLARLRLDAEARGLPALAGDLVQLDGLCDAMDSEGFFPFTDPQLAPGVGKVVQPLADIVDADHQRQITRAQG